MTFDEMLVRATHCEEMANRAWDKPTAYALREAASQWRTMATQMELLNRDSVYRLIRDRE